MPIEGYDHMNIRKTLRLAPNFMWDISNNKDIIQSDR